MAGKSKHSRKGQGGGGKKKKLRQAQTGAVEQLKTVAPASTEIARSEAPVRLTKTAAKTQALAGARYQYIPGELRKIGILGGIILIILVVLSQVLP